ncbi:MAG TPA: FtsX-like permease family protein [Gaiellaceae bacterium]|jgi:putative ABC transport system permease protein|nr:FtsX-like permease family protein [Gaiellaceae bacterium]
MTRVALKGLAGRKVRAFLTALAIVLGVAMVSGSFVLTDTISKAFTSIFTSAYDNTDAVVSGKKLVDYSSSGNATVSSALLDKVRAQGDVAAAAGSLADLNGDSTRAKLIGKDGKAIDHAGAPTFGFGIDTSQPRFNPLALESGRWAAGPDEVVIDPDTAADEHFAIGDSIGVAANGPAQQFRIVGIARYGDVESLGGATFAVFTIPTAQKLLHIDGFTAISVAAKGGVSQEQLVRELRTITPATVDVKTADEQAAQDKKSIAGFLTFIRGFLLGFGGIALFVGAFVIFNTLSITVAQRTRELATLRTLGATRRQVLRSVIVESAALGLLASVVGLFSGFALAKGLSSLFGALGLGLPEAATVYAARTFVVSLVLGVVVTVLSGIVPAVRATRIAPIAAARGGMPQKVRGRKATIVGVALLAAAALLLGYAVSGDRLGSGSSLLALAFGALALISGTAGVASRLVAALAALLGWPSRRFGGAAGAIASENATRNPQRTASTAAALMIGLALVSFVAVLGKGVHNSMDNAIEGQFTAPWIVTSKNGWSGFPTAAGDAAARAPGVTKASSIRADRALIGDTQVNVNGVDPATIGGLYRFEWSRGSSDATLAKLTRDGAIVKESFAKKNGIELGDRFVLRSPSGEKASLRAVGFYQPPRVAELLGGVIVNQHSFDMVVPRAQNGFTLLAGNPTQEALEKTLAAFPDTKVQTNAAFVKNQTSFMNSLLNLLYVLLALSVVVSLFGMINTLVLSVWERTREIGMLRAVGMSRRQARRMVRHESVITALIGTGLGLPLGVILAAAVTHGLSRFGVTFEVSIASLVAFTVVAIVAGLLAAIAPARRASRLNVLSALQYE